MPLFGQLNLQSVLARLPEMQDFETEPWELPGAEILQLSFEVGQESRRQPAQGHAPGCAPVCDLCY